MDKKNKKNGATTGSTQDKDRSRTSDSPSTKSKPVNIAISALTNNGDKATKVRAVSSTGTGAPGVDKDARNSSSSGDDKTKKAHAHDEGANGSTKNGPQKKRRKVTHGTALHPLPRNTEKHEAVVSTPNPARFGTTRTSLRRVLLGSRANVFLYSRVPTACVYCRRSVSHSLETSFRFWSWAIYCAAQPWAQSLTLPLARVPVSQEQVALLSGPYSGPESWKMWLIRF